MSMNPELKAKWVEALRSGEYKQGTKCLRMSLGDEDKYCCLGVLYSVAGGKWQPESAYGMYHMAANDGAFGSHLQGWGTKHGVLLDEQYRLACMNDEGKSLAEIADYIEANL